VLPDGVTPGTPVAAVPCGDRWALVWPGGRAVVGALPVEARIVWWAAARQPVRACWDLAAVGGLVHGLRRSDPAALWAAAHDRPLPEPSRGRDLFDVGGPDALDAGGDLDGAWYEESPTEDRALRWAALALEVQQRQAAALADRRALLTAYAESAAALLCLELAAEGLPLDAGIATQLLTETIGPAPADADHEARLRRERDRPVLDLLPPGTTLDLRSPEQVRGALARSGIDVPDTRSWRLEPHAAASPLVAALLAWRKADRVATTYGWRWLAENAPDGRLRGRWQVADGGAGRMTAGAGLHNMPAELRPAVRAEPGYVFVGADLGQVEPRVLAVVSGDPALAAAAGSDDMYAPVAQQLGVDRPTAKIAVLAAMYGQTSGVAGTALRDMDRVYGRAMAYLRAAEQVGRDGGELRTYGGRLIQFGGGGDVQGRGRYARNAMVQGAAAELFKAWAATVRAHLAGTGGRIVLCLHDELLLHVPESQSAAAQAVLASSLDQTVAWWAEGSPVRFVAEVRAGRSWPEVH
jgi:DNA polymerase-1